MIETIQIKKSFGTLEVLKGIDLKIKKAEIVSIVGASGAGKTTLLQILGTLSKATEGELLINNEAVLKLSPAKLAAFRNNHIGFVFQFHQLLPEFTAIENVCIPAFIQGKDKKTAMKEAERILDFLSLKNRIHHKPNELSGGEQQRVAVARALINNPSVILADEPSGNLDTKNKEELHQLFFNLRDEYKHTFVIVTHDMELAKMSDRSLIMKDGLIIK